MSEQQPNQIPPTPSAATPSWPHGPTKFELRFGNNVTRIVVGLVGIPLILAVVFLGGWWFFLLVAAMSTGALLEFYWMLEKRGIYANKKLGVVAGLLLLLPFAHGDFERLLGETLVTIPTLTFPGLTVAWEIGIALLTVIAVLILSLKDENRDALPNAMGTLLGFLYVSLLMATLLGVHHLAAITPEHWISHENPLAYSQETTVGDVGDSIGRNFILIMFAGIWMCDSFAYFGGRAFGKHKLFERVSPKKTWEGAISGLVAAIGTCVGLSFVLEGLSWYDGLFVGLAAGVFGQIGDLVESHIKRGCGVKDSSQIIPGHGGILDRFDSLLFVAPLVYIYLLIVVSTIPVRSIYP